MGEIHDHNKKGYGAPRSDKVVKGTFGDQMRGDRRNDYKPRDTRRDPYHPYVPPKNTHNRNDLYPHDNRRHEPFRQPYNRPGLGFLVKPPREILATEHHLNLPRPPPTGSRPRKENEDKFCEYHKERGHLTNDC